MSQIVSLSSDLEEVVRDLKARKTPFAFATVVRTVGSTSATPGAKAVLDADGTIIHGWLGGGCARGAVARVAKETFAEGAPKLVSVAPKDTLEANGHQAGENVDGVSYANNGCPSRGSIDVFIEPVLPAPTLAVLGSSPVAEALTNLAPSLDWSVSSTLSDTKDAPQAVIIATQGQGDLDALKSSLAAGSRYIAFVGSAKKFASLNEKLRAAGISDAAIGAVKAPAGLNIGARTPEEIAISILADLIQHRRNPEGDDDA